VAGHKESGILADAMQGLLMLLVLSLLQPAWQQALA
jgi:hypothetical protein